MSSAGQDLQMTSEEAHALADTQGLAAAGRIVISRHADERMDERGATFDDVREALATATSCQAHGDELSGSAGVTMEGRGRM